MIFSGRWFSTQWTPEPRSWEGVRLCSRSSDSAIQGANTNNNTNTNTETMPIPPIPMQTQYQHQLLTPKLYPSFDHPDHAGTIECNFVLGKADDHFQSWWVINYRISWCITFHMPIPYWQWHVTTYQYYIPHVNFVSGKADDNSQSLWVVDYHILSLCPRHFLKTKIDIWDCHDQNQSYGQF